MPKSSKSLAAEIKEVRLMKEWTFRQAAEKLEISHGTLYTVLQGKPVSDLTRVKIENRLAAARQAA